MTENAQNLAATNPSNADIGDSDYGVYLPVWMAASHIQLIVQNLLLSTYTDDIQKMFQSIQDHCSAVLSTATIPGTGLLSPSDAAKLIAPLAEQLEASPDRATVTYAGFIANANKSLASPSGA